MSEDRTQAPSKLRRQEARQRGQVAHSSELTWAAGWLAAVALLAFRGDALAAALLELVREPLTELPPLTADADEVVARLRHLVLALAGPLGLVVGGFATAAVAAHQAQVGGLLVPALLAPDPARLWAAGGGGGFATRAGRGVWGLVKAVVIVAVAAWAIRSGWLTFQGLGDLPTPALARACGQALRQLALALAVATLALGLVDYFVQFRRFETLLQTTPGEQREDMRATEGDPALRARRRQVAKAWRGDPAELLAGAALLLTGPAGLTIVLSGGPPPRRVMLRAALQGASGLRLRQAADRAGVPALDAPALARRLVRRGASAGAGVPAEALADLAAVWP